MQCARCRDTLQGFNPRSPLPGSDALALELERLLLDTFQSTLPVAGERCTSEGIKIRPFIGFNPRSPLPGSDARAAGRSTANRRSFNPRSPLPGSDAACRGRDELPLQVSIHAPRCRGAMPEVPRVDGQIITVSIHAPRCRGAMLPVGVVVVAGQQFQSTLPVAGERCFRPSAIDLKLMQFQSTLPVAGERCTKSTSGTVAPHLFQSTLPVAGERCSSLVSRDSVKTIRACCANPVLTEQSASYANRSRGGKCNIISCLQFARTSRENSGYSWFAHLHSTSGASKSVARKQPCSRTS